MEASGTINKKGSLYRLAAFYGSVDSYASTVDRCSYYRGIVAGIILATMIACFGGIAAAGLVGMPLAHIVAMVATGQLIAPDNPTQVIYMIWTGFGILGAIGAFLYIREARKEAKAQALREELQRLHGEDWYDHLPDTKNQPSELTKAYQAWKEKTCTLLKVE